MPGQECRNSGGISRPMPVEGGAAGEGERECTMFIPSQPWNSYMWAAVPSRVAHYPSQQENEEGLSFLSARKPVFALLWNQE